MPQRFGPERTSVGADAPGKQELEAEIFRRADVRVVNSIAQCIDHGDVSYVIKAGLIEKAELVELGTVINHPSCGGTNDRQITVADLTGVAVQDIQVAKLAFKALNADPNSL